MTLFTALLDHLMPSRQRRMATCSAWFEDLNGDDLNQEVIRALCSGGIVSGNHPAAAELAEAGDLICFDKGDVLIHKGDGDTDVYFVLHGKVTIERGQDGPIDRKAQVTVGELAAINPGRPRSAKVWAKAGPVATLKVSARDFAKVLERHPQIAEKLQLDINERFYAVLDHLHDLQATLNSRNSRWFWPFSLLLAIAFGLSLSGVAWTQTGDTPLAVTIGVVGILAILFGALAVNPAQKWHRLLRLLVCGYLAIVAMPVVSIILRIARLDVKILSPQLSTWVHPVVIVMAICISVLAWRKE
jgi:CRP-like cAMP-binding protein